MAFIMPLFTSAIRGVGFPSPGHVCHTLGGHGSQLVQIHKFTVFRPGTKGSARHITGFSTAHRRYLRSCSSDFHLRAQKYRLGPCRSVCYAHWSAHLSLWFCTRRPDKRPHLGHPFLHGNPAGDVLLKRIGLQRPEHRRVGRRQK